MSVDVLADQLKFMNLGVAAQENIQAVKTIITQELPGALDTFYAQCAASRGGQILLERSPDCKRQKQTACSLGRDIKWPV